MVASIRMLRDEDAIPYDAQAQPERRQGFAMIPAEVFAMQDMAALSVYAILAKHANKDGECWPSIQTICEALGVSKKTVQPAIDRLIEAKIITRERRFAHGMKASNIYRITVKDANGQMEPTVPTLVPTVPLDGTHGSTGWHPQHHKQEPVELDKEELEETPAQKSKAKPLPTNGVAQQIVAAYCLVARLEAPANYGKAVGQAAQLAKAGVTPEDIPSLYEYVAGWAKGADLGLMLNQVDRWRTSKRVATPTPVDYASPEYLAEVRRRANARLV